MDLFIVKDLIEKGMIVVDVGANFGLYTKFLSEFVGENGAVYSFEPIKKTFDALSNNVEKFNLRNVSIYNLGLSDSIGTAHMQVPNYDDGGENLYEARIVDEETNEGGEKIKTTTLQEILGHQERIDFVKIDVEGHELNVLQGGKTIIAQNQPVLLIEINGGIGKENEKSRPILQLLESLGYKPFVRDDKKIRPADARAAYFNFFFLTEEHKNKYRNIMDS